MKWASHKIYLNDQAQFEEKCMLVYRQRMGFDVSWIENRYVTTSK